MTDLGLAGKRVLITGAAKGIGRATAMRFADEGSKLALIDRDEEALQASSSAIVARGGSAIACSADVGEETAVSSAISTCVERLGGLDVVVANAGVQLFGQDDRVDRLDIEVWNRTLGTNLTGMFLTCKYGIRALLAAGGGSVVCIASPTGLYGMARGFHAYSASKGGVYGLIRVMASDYAAEHIRVNGVMPGFTDTPLVQSLLTDDAERADRERRTLLGRAGTAEEVAAVVAFIASDEASYVTGAVWAADGGITAI